MNNAYKSIALSIVQMCAMVLAFTIFGNVSLYAQACTNDTENPFLVCAGMQTLVLNSSGEGSITVDDVLVSATDNCGVNTITLSQSTFDCDDVGVQVITITVTDFAMNSNTCTANVVVVDAADPVLNIPPDATYECVLPATLPMATATDACGLMAPVSVTPIPTAPMSVPYSFVRTFSVTDNNLNTTTGTQLVTVTHLAVPTLTMTPNTFPLTQNVSCDAGPLMAPSISATDACGATLPVSSSSVSTQGSDPAIADFYNYTNTVTYSATDATGNSESIITEYIFSDSEAPTFTSTLATSGTLSTGNNTAGPCFAAFSADYSSEVSDNCASNNLETSYMIIDQSAPSVIAYSGQGLTVSENLATGVYDVILSATDPAGNTGSFTYVLTVADGNAPTAICEQNIRLVIDNSGVGVLTAAAVNKGSFDDCTAASDLILSLDRTTFDCSDIGRNRGVTLSVTDESGNTTTCTTRVRIVDGSNPSAFCQNISRTLDASGQTVVFPQDIAAGLISDFDLCGPTTGLISEDGVSFFSSITLDCSDGIAVPLTLQVTDGGGNMNTCTSIVTLVDAELPVASCAAISQNLKLNGTYELTAADSMNIVAASSDNCGIDRVTFSRRSFSCDDLDQDELATNKSDTVHILVTVFDATGNSDQCTAILTLNEVIAPFISCVDQTLSVDANGDLTVSGEQLLAGNVFLSTPADDSLTTASYTATNAYDLNFTFDAVGFEAGYDFGYILDGTITSLASGNTSGVATGSITVNLNAGQTIAFYVEAKDMVAGGRGGYVWIKSLSTSLGKTVPSSAISFAGNGDGFYADACGPLTIEVREPGGTFAPSIDFDCADITSMAGPTYPVELRVTDHAGNASMICTSNVTIVDESAPDVITLDQTAYLNQLGTVTVQAASFNNNGSSLDACDGANLTFTFVDEFGNDLGATMVIDCSNTGTRTVYIAAEDQSMNIGYGSATLTVIDALGPQISGPADLTQDCSESIDPVNTGLATAIDNCDGPIASVTYTDQTMSGASRNCRTIRRRFTAVDANGNIGVAFQMITITDNTAPMFTNDPMDPGYINPIQVAECEEPALVTPLITDNCDINVTDVVVDTLFDSRVSMGMVNVTPTDMGYYNYSIVRRWTATDSCGNSASRSQTQRVRDTQAPEFDASIQTTRVISTDVGSCSATVSFDLTGLVSDACAAVNTLDISNDAPMGDGEYLAQGSYPVGFHSITYAAEDPAGNIETLTIDFEVKDLLPPSVSCQSGFSISLSNGVATLSIAQVNNNSTDNCGIASYELSKTTFTCADVGTNTVTLTVRDNSNNVATCDATFIVTESSSLAFSATPIDVTVDCGDDLTDPAIVGVAEAISPCGTAATITYNDVTISGTSDNCRTIERTYTATSAAGLTVTDVQIITVEDNTVPVYVNAPLLVDRVKSFECTPDALPVITATDSCGVQPLVVISNEVNTQGANPALPSFYQYEIGRTYTATDGCNTASSITVRYSVDDTEAPVVNISDLTIPTDMGTCMGTVNIDLADLTTDCADAAYITFTNDSGIGNNANIISGVLAAGSYPINYTAEDPRGNDVSGTFTITIEDQEGPTAKCDNVIVSLLNGSATITASDVDDGSTDNCSAQGDLTYSIDQSVFTAPGDYPVVLTVTDEEGNPSNCTAIVSVLAPLTVTAGSASGITGETVQLGINATNFTNVTGLTGTVRLTDALVADFVDNVTYNPIFNPSDWTLLVNDDVITFIFSSTSQVTLPATGANLFMVDVELTGAIGDMSDVVIDGSGTQFTAAQNFGGTRVAVTPATGAPGEITVIGNGTLATISGALNTAAAEAIALADVGYLGTSSGTVSTGAAGTFSYTVPLGGTTTVTPFKDINYRNGVDIIDLADLKQHILTNPDKQINDAYNRIAADAEPDGNINLLDVIEVQALVLDPLNYEFTNNTSWRFVRDGQALPFTPNSFDVPTFDESATFSNVAADISGVNFTGVKIGDINRTADAATLTNGGGLQGRTSNTLEFVAQDQVLVAGETYQVELTTRDFNQVLGYQFTLSLGGQVATLDDFQPGVLEGMNRSNFNHASGQLLTHVWDNATYLDYADGQTVFTLTLTATENGLLSEVLSMNSELTQALAYGQDRSQWDVDLVFEQVSSTTSVLGESFSLSQNRPNPYSGATQIDFTLPNAEDVTFQVIDVNGRIVLQRRINGVAGKQTIELLANELPAAGVYHYQLITSQGAATKSMLLTK